MMNVKAKRIVIGISTIILIIIMIILIDIRIILEYLMKISFYGLILFFLIYTIAFIFRTYRLKMIFQGLNLDSSFLTLYCAFGIGWSINEITPSKLGDLVRIEFINEKEKNIGLSNSICGIAIERFIDLIILMIITCFALLYLYISNIGGNTILNLHFYVILGIILVIGGLIALIFLVFKTDLILTILGKISLNLRNKAESFIMQFLGGLKKFRRNKKKMIYVFILSILTWFFETLTLVILFYFTGYEINIFIIIFAQIVIFFTKTFPITPGGWIISENVGALLILLFYPSIKYNSILAIFFLDHLLRLLYVLVYGIISAISFNFKIKEMKLKYIKDFEIDEYNEVTSETEPLKK